MAWRVYLRSQHSKALSHFGRFTSAMDSVSAIPFWARLYAILRAGAILNATELHQWLNNYSYRIPLSPSIFVLAIVSSVLIAWITVAHRAIRAALANPVRSLRNE